MEHKEIDIDDLLSVFCTEFTFGWRLRRIRNIRNRTQKELGIICGFPESAADMRIRQYESNARHPKANIIKALSETLQISQLMLTMDTTDIQALLFATILWADISAVVNIFAPTMDEPLYEPDVIYPLNTIVHSNVPGIVPHSENNLLIWLNEYNFKKQQYRNKEISDETLRDWIYMWEP